jgi:hypothetical protein
VKFDYICRECKTEWTKLRDGLCFDCDLKKAPKRAVEPFQFKERYKGREDYKREAAGEEEPPY